MLLSNYNMFSTKTTIFCAIATLACIGLYSYNQLTEYRMYFTPLLEYRRTSTEELNYNSTCTHLLQEGGFINDTWHPTGCSIHSYTKHDLQACLLKRSQRKQKPYLIAFLGDSLMRQRYLSLMWLLLDIRADVWVDKPYRYFDNSTNTQFVYIVIRYASSGKSLITYLQNWNKTFRNESPDMLFVGFNYHVALARMGEDAYSLYKEEVKVITDILSTHSETHSVWIMPGQVDIKLLHRRKVSQWRIPINAYAKNLTSPLDEYDKRAVSVVSNSTIPLCTVLGKVKEHFVTRTMRNDGIHIGLKGLLVVRNIIIN